MEQRMSKCMCMLMVCVFAILLHQRLVGGAMNSNSGGGCDPSVDMLFVLDNSSNVNSSQLLKQRNFVEDLLKRHQAPKGAVRVAIVMCGDTNVSTTHFKDTFSALVDPNDHNSFTLGNSQEQHCLESVNLKLKTEARDGVARIAVILRNSMEWDTVLVTKQREIAQQESAVLVVIAIHVRLLKDLTALQGLASEAGTFFAIAGYNDLPALASNLSKDSCKPISLDLTSGSRLTPQTTSVPTNTNDPCVPLEPPDFNEYISGFGYIKKSCGLSQHLNITSCTCE